jgi:hypothetical protein
MDGLHRSVPLPPEVVIENARRAQGMARLICHVARLNCEYSRMLRVERLRPRGPAAPTARARWAQPKRATATSSN